MKACDLVENWLKEQGFRCERDGDGDVRFRYQGNGDRARVLEAINTISRDIKAIKAFLVEDSLWLSIEMYIDSTPDIEDFIERCLDIMIAGRNRIAKEILG